jgi:hypothetical protein
MNNISEEDLKTIKSWLFVAGGIVCAIIGIYFSKTGFGFEVPGMAWIGWSLAILCLIVQLAFSSQLAYRSYNYVIFVCGVLAYIYSGWSNYVGIVSLSPGVNIWFAILLAEFIDWVAEPLIVYGLIGVSDNAEGDFLRNLLGRKAGVKQSMHSATSSNPPMSTFVRPSYPDYDNSSTSSSSKPVGRPRMNK